MEELRVTSNGSNVMFERRNGDALHPNAISIQDGTGNEVWSIMRGDCVEKWEAVQYATPRVVSTATVEAELASLAATAPAMREIKLGIVPPGWSQVIPEESQSPQLEHTKMYSIVVFAETIGSGTFNY